MAKASRHLKTITLNKSRDIIVEKLLKQCEGGAHTKCTGWAVLKKDFSPIDANYFLKCTCACHHKKERAQSKKRRPRRSVLRKLKKKVKQKLVKKGKKTSRKTGKR